MLKASEVLTAFVTKLRDIPALIDLLPDEDRIIQHSEIQPLMEILTNVPLPGILVAWSGLGVGLRGTIRQFGHRITIYVRVQGDPSEILQLLVNGVPANGDGQSMLLTEIHPLLFPMEQPSIERQQIELGPSVWLDYWRVTTQFTQRRN